MAYPSKAERMERFQDYLHREWMASLAHQSTTELQTALEAIQANLARTPKRHTYRISRMETKVSILQFTINKRGDKL